VRSPHAAISAIQIATNQSYVVQTDGQGRSGCPYLPAGEYQISVEAEGFSKTTREVQLNVGSAFDITLQLKLVTTATDVKVTAEPPVVEENRSQISQTVLQPEIASLPYQGRNYLDVALLLPGVSPTNTASTQTRWTSEVVGQGYSREQPAQFFEQLHRRWAFGQR
jgi:hypothetical protein